MDIAEICGNGVDDDGDGFIDNADPDCGCSETIMLVARDNGKILRVNLETGGTSNVAVTSPFVSGNLNAIAANPDNNLVYYCRDKIVYYWVPATGEQDTVVNLQGKIGANESLSSGGGEYYNGYLYLGTESGNPGANPKVWRQQLSIDGKSFTGNPVNLNIPIPSNLSWGDLIVTAESGQTVIYGMAAASKSHFWKYNINTGIYKTIRNDLFTEMQLGVDIYGNTWAGSLAYGVIQKISRTTGNFYGDIINFGGNLWDLTGPINCPQAIENCSNNIDDDGDGYTDLQDQDCLCPEITPKDAVVRTICEGQSFTFKVTTNAPNPPYAYIEFLRFESPQSNPYTSTATKVSLGKMANTGNVNFSTSDFPVSSGNSKTYYVYACVNPAPQYPGTCSPMVEYTVNVNNAPLANAGPDVTLCSGSQTTLNASATGISGTLTYSWNKGLGNGASKTISPTSTTVYTVTVTSSNGCSSTAQVKVTVSPAPIANAGSNQNICANHSTTIKATATGGVGPYTFTWDQGLGSGATKTITPTTTKTYTVTVTGNNGCAASSQVTITVSPCVENCFNSIDDDGDGMVDCADEDCIPSVLAGQDVIICGGSFTMLTASSPGGSGNLVYTWSHGLGNGAVKTVSPSLTTEYIVSVSNNAGCMGVDTVKVTVQDCPEVCTNGVDDDGDGLIDCDDPDCSAAGAPQLADDYYTTCPGLPLTERVSYNDDNLQQPQFAIASQPFAGFVFIDETGKFIYTPYGLDCTVDSFVYQVCNAATGCCDEAVVKINMNDGTPPVLSNTPADITIGCDNIVPDPSLVFGFDACPGIYIDYQETTESYGAGACDAYQIIRTWTATDLCGNYSSDQQIITVEDLTPPQILQVYTLPNGKRLVAGHARRSTELWKYVPFPITFDEKPLVFAQLITTGEAAPAVVRLRNISKQGFEMRLKEEEASAGDHAPETVAWLAIEPGTVESDYELDAQLASNFTEAWKTHSFDVDFSVPPAFFAAVQTNAEPDAVQPRVNNITFESLDIMLDEEISKDAETAHSSEQLACMAFSPKKDLTDENGNFIGESGMLDLTNAWATVQLTRQYNLPVILIGTPTNQDGDPVTVRVRNASSQSFEVRLQEWAYQDGIHGTEQVGYLVVEGSVPADQAFYCGGNASLLSQGVNIFAQDNCDNQVFMEADESYTLLTQGLQTSRTWLAMDDCGLVKVSSRTDTCEVAALKLKTYLHGSFFGNGNSQLMRDDLRKLGLLPATEPFSSLSNFTHSGKGGGETVSPALLAVTGSDAVVDWVFIEIRETAELAQILATQSALLQADGDVVTAAGGDVLYFPSLQAGEYFVTVRHRNHIGIMTDSKWKLSSAAPPSIDFTNPSVPARGFAGTGKTTNGVRMQWSGDLNGDRRIIYQGPNNDVFYLFSRVLADPGNISNLANYISTGYDRTDLNMDGKIIYQGPGNEKAMLLYQTVMSYPANGGFLANYIVLEFLP